ncbi:MAG: tryptophan 7-halogenase [Caulobacter sp.]|nr:tryptophan 7-halogenase [Caulobacter sp.]
MTARAPTRVVVVGRDAPLWLSAAVLQAALRAAGVQVSAVELPSRLGVADVHVCQPPLEALHNQLRLDEATLLRANGGAFTLGQNFVDSTGRVPAFFHAHGAYGAPIDRHDFFPCWLKARGLGLEVAFEDFSPTAVAARQGRVLIPDEETEVFGRADYAYHLPAVAYAAFLADAATRMGVERHPAQALGVRLDSASGDVVAIDLGGGRVIEGDLFIDATGEEAVLIGAALGVARDDWRAFFPVDRLLSARAPRLDPLPAYAEIRAGDHGWTGLHPTRTATHVLHAWSSADGDDEAALRRAGAVAGLPLEVARVAPISPGRARAAWSRNCVAVGRAACVFDPLHGVDLLAVQLGLVHLLGLFPTAPRIGAERAEYNRITASAFERIRDFQSVHYALNRYGEGAFWKRARAVEISPELARKIATFRARGEAPALEDESFVADSWRAMLLGHGLVPQSHPPRIDRTAPETLKAEFRRVLGLVATQVRRQPAHGLYLEGLG